MTSFSSCRPGGELNAPGAMRSARAAVLVASLFVASLLAACGNAESRASNEAVLAPGERCIESTSLSEDVQVSSAEELEALAGCEQLSALLVEGVSDLRPLGALRRVVRTLEIRDARDGSAGPVSFEGLGALERVGTLRLQTKTPTTLQGLEGLREVTRIELVGTNLENLEALSRARGFTSLNLAGNEQLRSLDGIVVPDDFSTGELNFGVNPLLIDLDAISNLRSVGTLTVFYATLGNLEAFGNLERVGFLDVSFTPLESVSGLRSLRQVERANFAENLALARIDVLSGVTAMRNLAISGSAQLEGVDLAALETIESLRVSDNAGPLELGLGALRQAGSIALFNDAGLTSVALPALQSAENISIHRNPVLAAVGLGSLSTVSTLLISLNPSLDSQAIALAAGISIAVDRVAGNADMADASAPLHQRLLDPCPWPFDEVCDACESAPPPGADPDFDPVVLCPSQVCAPASDAVDCFGAGF